MPGPWVEKLSDQIKQTVALLLERRVKDPRLGFVTITDVRVTGDGREATIFYSVLPGGDGDEAATAAALESAKGMIRTKVGRKLGLKFVPSLTFVADAVPKISHEMELLLDKVKDLDAELAERRVDGAYAGDPDPYVKKPDDEDDASAS